MPARGSERERDFLGDAPVVELRDHFDLRSQTISDPHAQRANGSESLVGTSGSSFSLIASLLMG